MLKDGARLVAKLDGTAPAAITPHAAVQAKFDAFVARAGGAEAMARNPLSPHTRPPWYLGPWLPRVPHSPCLTHSHARPRALPPPFTAQAGLADVPLSPLDTALSFIAGAPSAPSKAALAKGCKEAYGVADTLLAQAAARAHAHAHEHRNTRASHACIPVICCVHERPRAHSGVAFDAGCGGATHPQGPDPHGLTRDEIAAVHIFTQDVLYRQLNASLRRRVAGARSMRVPELVKTGCAPVLAATMCRCVYVCACSCVCARVRAFVERACVFRNS